MSQLDEARKARAEKVAAAVRLADAAVAYEDAHRRYGSSWTDGWRDFADAADAQRQALADYRNARDALAAAEAER